MEKQWPEMFHVLRFLQFSDMDLTQLMKAILRQFMHKKHKQFGTEVYKLCDCKGYARNMIVYLGKDWKFVTDTVTTTQLDGLQGLKMCGTSSSWTVSSHPTIYMTTY
jgi:hypothetical protein